MTNRFPHLTMDEGKRFYFGQALAEAETIFGVSSKQLPPELARYMPQQRTIETEKLILTFDAGRLMRMEFLPIFEFNIPLGPYSVDWKNFEQSDFTSLGTNTTLEEMSKSLNAWETRAIASGARKVEPGNDLLPGEFSTYFEEIEFWSAMGINMGESRRAGGGGLWMDGWIIQFTTTKDTASDGRPSGVLRSISAFCDEFNTAARRQNGHAASGPIALD